MPLQSDRPIKQPITLKGNRLFYRFQENPHGINRRFFSVSELLSLGWMGVVSKGSVSFVVCSSRDVGKASVSWESLVPSVRPSFTPVCSVCANSAVSSVTAVSSGSVFSSGGCSCSAQ